MKKYLISSKRETTLGTGTLYSSHRYPFILTKKGLLPALTLEGKIILKDEKTVQFAPNGNGAIYQSMLDYGVIEHLDSEGIEYVHFCGIDNILVKLGEPSIFGIMAKKGLNALSKYS